MKANMDLFIVRPNLELFNCEDCPTQSCLIDQKSDYLQSLSKCQSICHLKQRLLPYWCHDSSKDVDCNSLAHGRRVSMVSDHSDVSDCSDTATQHPNSLNIVLQSIALTDDDIEDENLETKFPLSRLQIPGSLKEQDKEWLQLKQLQLQSDIELVKYKYLKSFIKINRVVKESFSKKDLSNSDEEKGLKTVSKECIKFRALERILNRLTNLMENLNKTYSHILTAA